MASSCTVVYIDSYPICVSMVSVLVGQLGRVMPVWQVTDSKTIGNYIIASTCTLLYVDPYSIPDLYVQNIQKTVWSGYILKPAPDHYLKT